MISSIGQVILSILYIALGAQSESTLNVGPDFKYKIEGKCSYNHRIGSPLLTVIMGSPQICP